MYIIRSYKDICREIGIVIPLDLWQRIVEFYAQDHKGVLPKYFAIEEYAKQRILSVKTQLDRLHSLKISKNSRCLDVGGGIGIFAVLANLNGYKFYTYDVSNEAITIAKDLFRVNNCSANRVRGGSNMFNETKFDLITSFQVIEHVKNLQEHFRGLYKMITEKGVLFIESPNYVIPYEPHFYLFILPSIKRLSWAICKLNGRNNKKFFNELNFITPKLIEKTLKKEGFVFYNLGKEEWIKELTDKPTKDRSKYIYFASAVIRKLNFEWFIKYTATKGFYTPLRYLVYREAIEKRT